MSRALTFLISCSAGMLLGCGDGRPSLVKASGTILLDGKPVEGAMVMFQPAGDAKADFKRPSAAVTDASGKFVLGTYEKDDGVPPGKYKVGVQKRELIGNLPANFDAEKPGAYSLKYKVIVPKKYADPATAGLDVEVTSSELVPASLDLSTGGEKPEIEMSGPQRRANDP